MLRVVGLVVFGGGAGWVAVASYRIWEQAARNSASPGAIVLLMVAGIAGLAALFAAIALVVLLVRRTRG